MQKRTLKVALLAVLAIILVLGFSGTAFADQTWTDLPDTVTAKYGITDNQVAAISDGFGTLWKPDQSVTRAQFIKMAVMAFKIDLKDPATATFTDVAKGSIFYKYVEGAKAAGLTNGKTPTTFVPNAPITRVEAISIISRWISKVNGYDLATMYTAADIAGLLAHFGDKASIDATFAKEVAFAYDFEITLGDAYGNFAPTKNLPRIQAATFLIRAQLKVPPAQWTADKIELVSADKTENLIGQVHTVTFKVTDSAGHPAVGVLVDFDTLTAGAFYVGNISAQAAVTDSFGEVKANLISHEPGDQKMSATIKTADGSLDTEVVTKYWLALDEVYITSEELEAENNAGEAHEWGARVIVLGPGPLSTEQGDWYNAFDPAADLSDIDEPDGIDWLDEYDIDDNCLSYADELELIADGWMPRTMAGITVEWSLVNTTDDDPETDEDETVASVGKITKVDGAAITPATTANGTTDEDGLSTITIESTVTGWAWAQAVATYDGNPYPKQLINHDMIDPGYQAHTDNWDDQPAEFASAWKLWIPHVIGGDDGNPIDAASYVNNTGEVEKFVLTLEDVYGNPIDGYTVMWWIQGVGEFKTDDSSWSGVGEQNKDWDTTDADGMAEVYVKSLIPGQTIVHCKVMDKYGLPYREWNEVKQWYSIDDVRFIDDWSEDLESPDDYPENEVNTGHMFTVKVSGAKYVHSLYDVNKNGLSDDQVLLGDREDMKWASGKILVMKANMVTWEDKDEGVDVLPGQVFQPDNECGSVSTLHRRHHHEGQYYTRFADMDLADNEYMWDADGDGIDEVWAGLAGKGVNFFTNIGTCRYGTPADVTAIEADFTGGPWCWFGPEFDEAQDPVKEGPDGKYIYVGGITGFGEPWTNVKIGGTTYDYDAVTDAMGEAWVTINSTAKGWQFVWAVADYPENPQDGVADTPTEWYELRWDCQAKLWEPADADDTETIIFGQDKEDDEQVVGDRWVNPVLRWERGQDAGVWPDVQINHKPPMNLNTHIIAVQVFDEYGNALEGYKVTWEIIGQGTTTSGSQPTYHPYAHFMWPEHDNPLPPYDEDDTGDRNPNVDSNPIWDGKYDKHEVDRHRPLKETDDDYAWGWTLNHEIDFNLTLDSAAHVTLVLDETCRDLFRMRGVDHFTNIVNIKIYTPAGAVFDEFEVTKVWSLEKPELTELVLEQMEFDSPDDWTTDPVTTVEGQSYRVWLIDQFGNPIDDMTFPNDKVYFDSDVAGNDFIIPVGDMNPDGYLEFGSALMPGEYTVTYWIDDDGDNNIDDDFESNSVLTIIVMMEDLGS